MFLRLLTLKNNRHTDLRTSHAQLSEKGCQDGEEDSNNKIFSQKEYITGEKVKIIEIIFLSFFACLHECAQGSQLQCFNWSIAEV